MAELVRRVFAWVGLVAFVGGVVLPVLSRDHLEWDDDLECGSAVLTAGHARSQIEAPLAPPRADHCALCHWQRVLAGVAPADDASFGPRFGARSLRLSALERADATASPLKTPSRAPPAVSFL
jgi:hypothetical protein